MENYKQLIERAGKLLLAHPIGKMPSVDVLWKSIKWQPTSTADASVSAALSFDNENQIKLYPSLLSSTNANQDILREFGLCALVAGGARAASIWNQKLLVPDNAHVKLFDAKLKDAQLRSQCATYRDLLEKGYPNKGHSVERLIAIHFINALLANNVPYPDSVGIDINQWGPTQQFATCKRKYSLIPLTSAYSPKFIHENFGCAFSDLICYKLKSVSDRSVADGLTTVIYGVLGCLNQAD